MLFGKLVNKYYIKYGIYILLGCVALFFVDYFQLKVPEIISKIIDGLKDKTLTKNDLIICLKSLIIITLVMFIGRFLWRFCFFGNGVRIETDIRNELFFSMQKMSQSYFSDNKTGALMSLYTNDISVIRRNFGMGGIMFFDALFLGTMAIYKMFKLNLILTFISLSSLIIITILGSIIGKKITKLTTKNFEAYGKLSEFVQEDLSGIGVVKAFVKEKLQIKRFQKYNQENMDSTLNMVRLSVKMSVTISLLLTSIVIFIIGYGSYLVYLNSIGKEINFTVGNLTEFIAYYSSLIWPMEAVGRLIELSSQGRASIKRIEKVINHEVEINNDLVTNFDLDPLQGNIVYNNLTFSYPSSDIIVLKDISFEIKKGEFVGILGETGVGKTTLVDLLLRIYNINENTLFLDGVDIMKLPFEYVRKNIAYVPQDNFLFSTTIKDNIAFSEDCEVDNLKVVSSAKNSDVDKDIVDFKESYETILGERGVTVSGGQKQRISIARALYKNAPILILDDSLSAVDTHTEKTIIKNLREMRKGLTTIIIAHRISTLQDLDKIIVLDEGKVSGVGNHDYLLENNDIYRKEAKLQELEKEVNNEEE